jgi:pyruvate/2-oxoglutarate dehydrogenase complex dihydrolipoamide dehydrogenase (E3) component/uncharacterized membrane protein YdjX (TVP38/TMEM64 family)
VASATTEGRAKRIAVFAVVALLLALFFYFDFQRYLTFGYLHESMERFHAYYAAHRLLTILVYLGIYIAVTALSLPGAAVMTLAGGALFGLLWGTVIVSFASTIGATLAFLVSRYLFRDWVVQRFGDRMAAINRGVATEGGFYLFTLRLVPVFPFFVINLAMGLTPIRAVTFYFVSQIGMLPGTLVYINAGTMLGKLESAAGILSPAMLASFALLGVFPLLARKATAIMKNRRALAPFRKPSSFDYNMVIIGAGSAGLVSAIIGSTVRARVAMVEEDKMGGDCLNTGCVPSKALIRSARMLSYAARAKEFGFRSSHVDFDFGEVMERVQAVIRKVAPRDSVERFTAMGVDCIRGRAEIVSPWEVKVDDRVLSSRAIIVATGARPFVPPVPGLDKVDYLTSDTIWNLRRLPRRLVVLGGGPIGCELTQAFARLGSRVTQIEMAPRILIREDPEISTAMERIFQQEGVQLLTGHRAVSVAPAGAGGTITCEHDGEPVTIPFDAILVAVGRAPSARGFGLEELGVTIADNGTVATDEFLQTSIPTIFCAGDVAGPYQFTHTSAHQAWYASVNALFGGFKKFRADYRVIPWTTYVDPEVARVGLNESEAVDKGIAHEVSTFDMGELDRAITDGEEKGLVKVLTRPGSDKILGVTIMGPHAGDVIAEYVLAMKQGLGLNKILGTIHVYPTLAEANKYAAGEWKKAHKPETLLRWIETYHRWKRGTPQ